MYHQETYCFVNVFSFHSWFPRQLLEKLYIKVICYIKLKSLKMHILFKACIFELFILYILPFYLELFVIWIDVF